MVSDRNSQDNQHVPVMVGPVNEYLKPSSGKKMLDATLGFGGHSSRLAEKLSPGGLLIGLDRDADAIKAATARLEQYRSHLEIITLHSEFSKIQAVLTTIGHGTPLKLDGFLFDLGVSSYQLDSAAGFSFRRDEFLDGRMNREGQEDTVADILANTSEQELARILWEYGDERFSRRIAKAIVEFRAAVGPISTTGQLVKIVEKSVPRGAWPRDIHVATKVFQALRIRCNAELDQLEVGLNSAIDCLAPGGRIVVLSYHSLEDRIVKSTFARRAGKEPSPSGFSPAALSPNLGGSKPDLNIITRKPLEADAKELQLNIRARSAKLRCAERTTS